VITILGWLGNREESLTGEQLFRLGQSRAIFARPQLRNTLQRLSPSSTIIDFTSPFSTTIDAIGAYPEDCTVIASGDPNFFGITKIIRRAFPDRTLRILPAPSSIAVLAARLGRPWDDLSVVSLVGRDSDTAFHRARLRLADRQAGAVALLDHQTPRSLASLSAWRYSRKR
jgi:precorrin-6Y C5,15-methyltransferase (decarboxylating)